MLTLHDGEQRDPEEGPPSVEPVLKSNLFYPNGTIYHRLVIVKAVDILVIAHKTIQVESDKIIDNVKKREMPRFAMVRVCQRAPLLPFRASICNSIIAIFCSFSFYQLSLPSLIILSLPFSIFGIFLYHFSFFSIFLSFRVFTVLSLLSLPSLPFSIFVIF